MLFLLENPNKKILVDAPNSTFAYEHYSEYVLHCLHLEEFNNESFLLLSFTSPLDNTAFDSEMER